jgi:hypothetical protein
VTPVLAVAWDVLRVVSLLATVVSAGLLAFSVRSCRRPTPVRTGSDLVRLAVTTLGVVVMAIATGVSTAPGLVAVAAGGGLLLGVAQGWNLQAWLDGERLLVRRSALGVAAWGSGVVIAQGAGIAARASTLRLGQAVSWFGIGVLAGSLVGRHSRLQHSRLAVAPVPAGAGRLAAVAVVALALGAAVSGGSPGVDGPQPSAAEVCADLAPDGASTVARYYGGDSPDRGPTAACIAERGPYEFFIVWLAPGTDAEAAVRAGGGLLGAVDGVPRQGLPPGAVVADVGGFGFTTATERADATGYGVEFGRGPVYVDGSGSSDEGATAAGLLGVAREIDAKVVAALPTDQTDPQPTPALPDPTPDSGAGSDDAVDPGDVTGETGDDLLPPVVAPSVDVGADEPDVTSGQAVAQALTGLIAAAALGVISLGDARVLGDSLVLGGPLTPGEAIHWIDRLTSPTATGSRPAAAGPVPTPPDDRGPRQGAGPAAGMGTHTVVLTGAAARAALAGGRGARIDLPSDVQWDENVEVEGAPPHLAGWRGDVGIVRTISAVGETDTGEVSIVVDVDTYGDPPPVPDLDEVPMEPVSGSGGEATPVGPRQPSPLPDLDEVPGGPPPGPGEVPLEPIGGAGGEPSLVGPRGPAPVEETGPDPGGSEPEGGEPTGEEPSGEEPSGEEPPVDGEDVGPPGVVLDPVEIEDVISWGVDHNRSPDDIRADLDWRNQAQGGTGPVGLPVDLVQVDTPNGPVTLTAEEADAYRKAQAEAERLAVAKDQLKERMAEVERDMARWRGWELMPEHRAAAGVADLLTRAVEHEAEHERLVAEIVRLRRDPAAGGTGATIEDLEAQLARSERAHMDLLRSAGRTWTQTQRELDNKRDLLESLKAGSFRPDPADYPEGGYEEALTEWNTARNQGEHLARIEQLEREIRAREVSVEQLGERLDRGEQLGLGDVVEELTTDDQPHVPKLEPAAGGDRGTAFDRPARELERIARERDRLIGYYRGVDAKAEEIDRAIAEIEGRAGGG